MSSTQRPGSERPRQTSHREESHIVRSARVQPAASSAGIQAQPTHRCHRLERCHTRGNRTAAEWNQVVFSDESRSNVSSDDNRVRLWRPRGKRLNPDVALKRNTTLTAVVLVWGAFAYNTRIPLVLFCGTMTAQRYVHYILQPHVLPLMQRFPGAIYQQDNARPHTARFTCRNCGGGDSVAIYRPFGEFRRAKSYCHLYGAQGQRPTLAHATMNFVGLDLTTSNR
ncbi:transposable element Tcb2 transposase [Trichonephila clavipes]|nr:transposable element Tcb2 transposase [Trichonephila clavipes]